MWKVLIIWCTLNLNFGHEHCMNERYYESNEWREAKKYFKELAKSDTAYNINMGYVYVVDDSLYCDRDGGN